MSAVFKVLELEEQIEILKEEIKKLKETVRKRNRQIRFLKQALEK